MATLPPTAAEVAVVTEVVTLGALGGSIVADTKDGVVTDRFCWATPPRVRHSPSIELSEVVVARQTFVFEPQKFEEKRYQ
jgi:hypothetical protein